jgi:hypothetical protein
MADRFPGKIVIGGKVPSALLEEFLGEVASSGASVGDYGDPPFEAGRLRHNGTDGEGWVSGF